MKKIKRYDNTLKHRKDKSSILEDLNYGSDLHLVQECKLRE